MLLDYYATTGAKREIRTLHWSKSSIYRHGVERHLPVRDDPNKDAYAEAGIKTKSERQRQVKDTETSALVEEDEHQGVDGGEAGVVRLVQGGDELLKGGHEAVGLGGGNRAENKRNAAPSLAPRLEGKRNRNGVPVTWDGAAIAATNIVSQPRNRERTRPSNFRSGAFLVTIPVPYREATASGRFNESRFADIDKHLKLGAIVERHVSEKPPGEPLVPTRFVDFDKRETADGPMVDAKSRIAVLQEMEIFSVDEESAFPNVKLRIPGSSNAEEVGVQTKHS
eukprot:g15036.t1